MARNSFPGMKSSSGLVPKLIGILILVAALVLVVKHPGDSASWVSGVAGGIGDAVDGVANFLRALTR